MTATIKRPSLTTRHERTVHHGTDIGIKLGKNGLDCLLESCCRTNVPPHHLVGSGDMTLADRPVPVVTEFERIIPPEIQRVFDQRCEGSYASQEDFRAAVREARMAVGKSLPHRAA